MKRGTKATVFIASMALTVGSLIAIVGPRRYGHCGKENYYNREACHHWNKNSGPGESAIPETK
jgi:hypothetical protein